eukprot:CAMPEP_0170297920 /NCGR_PEP_ID=MMETSP0116_2-20130129/49128_1 /TAXON_ID=400756 /ORGANISM="Durinskia baltica, Strain CSIRO CS-38" /LENGTH=451 /DNA_ID=CAMNT_0010549559 /DNA_START=71 /DNA_END=1424 /DNA_ORIENTATION=-
MGHSYVARESLLESLKSFTAKEWKLGRHVIFKPDPDGIDFSGWVFSSFCAFRGRALAHILLPLLVIMVEATVVAMLSHPAVMADRPLVIPASHAFEDFYRMLGVPVSFLLVFRLNRAAVRFYDSRAAFGKLIECSRVLAGQAVQYLSHDPVRRDSMCRWVVVYPFAARNYLRGHAPPDAKEELAGLLNEEEAEQLSRAKMQPLLCLDRIRGSMWSGAKSNTGLPPSLVAQTLNNMEATLATITGTVAAMERINNTPLPIAWVAHLRQFLLFYLLGIPFSLQSSFGWATPLVTLVISVAMLGLESAAVSCERPFGHNTNHLPMTLFCKVIAENVQQILSETECMDGCADGCTAIDLELGSSQEYAIASGAARAPATEAVSAQHEVQGAADVAPRTGRVLHPPRLPHAARRSLAELSYLGRAEKPRDLTRQHFFSSGGIASQVSSRLAAAVGI